MLRLLFAILFRHNDDEHQYAVRQNVARWCSNAASTITAVALQIKLPHHCDCTE